MTHISNILSDDQIERLDQLIQKDQITTEILHDLVKYNHIKLVNQIISKCSIDINCKQEDKHILHVAVQQENTDLIKTLLLSPNLLLNEQDENEETPLHLAVIYNNSEILSILLDDNRTDPNIGQLVGITPLHIATEKPNNTLAILLKYSSVDVNVSDSFHNTPLHRACKFNNLNAVKLLLKHKNIQITKNFHGNKPNDLSNHKPINDCFK